ncbi:alpha-catulin-like [Chanos chanos]|uniref:Alpha-catulin n=1 Tax=Chanos chanos TaxID=29144 RepID=A0A6J2W4I6_CHACN|nr:alpha-catulin-like [Chanos chanos]
MAVSSSCVKRFDAGLEIKTRSVEQTLIPLVSQITTLINHKDKLKRSERTAMALQRVGQAVSGAVEHFVAVGEAIAAENEELQEEMTIACLEARKAGDSIARFTDVDVSGQPDGLTVAFEDKAGVVKAARMLLSSVTRVLLLADQIIVKQISSSHSRVLMCLDQLEHVSCFQEFVQIFSQFGNEMVEFAHLTGDRQNDLKDEKKKAKMAAARSVLEKCTMMLLTASKTCLRHPDCPSAQVNKESVFGRMRWALDEVIEIVTDTHHGVNTQLQPVSIYSEIRGFKAMVERLRDRRHSLPEGSLRAKLVSVIEQTEDFTDSAYTGHKQRQKILQLCHLTKQELEQLLSVWTHNQTFETKQVAEEKEVCILKTVEVISELREELHNVAVGLATDMLKQSSDRSVLRSIRVCAGEGDIEALAQCSCALKERKEQLLEMCRLLRHVSGMEPLEITCLHAEKTFQVIGPQIVSAAQTLTLHPSSKIAKENLDVFCDAWESQLSDLNILLKEIVDVYEGTRAEKSAYQSLPRSGKHLANKEIKSVKLDTEEQNRLAKLGMELKQLASLVDTESRALQRQDVDHPILDKGQSMSSLAHSIYLFTRGEGVLKTTLDLFHQAEVFSKEGFQLCSSLQLFSTELEDEERELIMTETERLAASCSQLQSTVKMTVEGKTAIFLKVDTLIQNTKNVMATMANLLPLYKKLLRKVRITVLQKFTVPPEYSQLTVSSDPRDRQLPSPTREGLLTKHASKKLGVKSVEKHMASLTSLESK